MATLDLNNFENCRMEFMPKRPNNRVSHSGYARVLRVENNINIPPVTVLLGGIQMN